MLSDSGGTIHFLWYNLVGALTVFLSGLAAFPGGWIASGANGTLLRSGPDAASWTHVPMNTTNWLYRVRWTGDQLLVVGQNGALYTSPDGSAWTPRTSGTKTG